MDFETKSRVNLLTAGTDTYVSDPSTDILCAAFTFSDPLDTRAWVWRPDVDGKMQFHLWDAINDHLATGGLLAAHNARFDQGIWECIAVNDYGFPPAKQDQWYCTSAQARVNALPANLDDATRALNASHRKSHKGANLIRKLSIPQPDGTFNQDPALLAQMATYCLDDVKATKAMVNSCRKLSGKEHTDWLINERINDRGVRIDLPLALACTEYAEIETEIIGQELSTLTHGVITKHTQNQRIKAWILQRVSPDVEKLTVTYKDGERKNSLAKDIRQTILNRADAGELTIPDDVYDVIACLDDGNKSSVSKFKRMVERYDTETGRVHGSFMYAGASTLRYTSRGLQLHNFRRDCLETENVDELRQIMLAGGLLHEGTVMDTLSKMLRPALIPADGHVFVVGDWSSIEGRALPWLSADPRAESKLDAFRNGEDLYVKAATDAGVEDRQVGKVIELSLGYGGSVGAFNSMAKNYGVYLPDHRVKRLVDLWRRANPWAEDFWNRLEKAARNAFRYPHAPQAAGRVEYVFIPQLMGGSLICVLPDGSKITYPQARVEKVSTDYGVKSQITALKANWKPSPDDDEWPRYRLWRGLLAENVTQAFCAALLREKLASFNNSVLHCHDEIALEVLIADAKKWERVLQDEMEKNPPWAVGLPLKAEPKIMYRYGK
jgi:DNA polymerase